VLPLRSPIIPTRSSLTCHCQKLPPTVDHPRDHHLPQKFLLSPPPPFPIAHKRRMPTRLLLRSNSRNVLRW
jgi:hypothetical protein